MSGLVVAPVRNKVMGKSSLFLENEFHEGGVQIVSDVLVLLLFGDKFVCAFPT